MTADTEINHSTGTFTGVGDTEIYFQQWAPAADKLRGAVVLIHGIGEHSARYEAFAGDLVEAGYAVCSLDHRGHGKSEGKRCQVSRFDEYIDDVATYEAMVRKKYPAPLPLFLLGHSLGGLITLRYATRDNPAVTGIVVSGAAAAKPVSVNGATVAIGKVLSVIAPDVPVVPLPLEKISRDPEVVREYEADELVYHGKIKARLAAETLGCMEVTAKALPDLTDPILILHGSDDEVTPADGSRMIDATVGSSDKTMIIYDGLWHEIFNEPERDRVIGDVVAWLNVHTSQ